MKSWITDTADIDHDCREINPGLYIITDKLLSMRPPQAQSGDDDSSHLIIPSGPTYRPPVVLIGVAMWTLALASIGTIAVAADFRAVGTIGVHTVGTLLRAFAGVGLVLFLFPLIAHFRLRLATSE